MSASPSPGPSTAASRHAQTAVDRQRAQLEKLLKDPAKPAYIPPPPKDKTIRAPREMMKNVQGSSAGAGSGEFHVYKASRRREYERLKLMEEESQKVRIEHKQSSSVLTDTLISIGGRNGRVRAEEAGMGRGGGSKNCEEQG